MKEKPTRKRVIDTLNDNDLQEHSRLLYELDKDKEFDPMEHLLMDIRFMDTFED